MHKTPAFLLFIPLFLMFAIPSNAALLVDDCEGTGAMNRLGGSWSLYTDSYSTLAPPAFNYSGGGRGGGYCVREDYEIKSGFAYPYVGFNTSFQPRDLSGFEGVRFQAKGEGQWSCMVPVSGTLSEYNHYAAPLRLSPEWKLVELPFAVFTQTWGTKKPFDLTAVTGVQWQAGGRTGDKGWIAVDDVEFFTKKEARAEPEEKNPILKGPKVNQAGYLPDGEKYFAVSEPHAKKGDAFRVLDEAGKEVLKGKVAGDSVDDKASTGERVYRVDFSGLTLTGRFRVECRGTPSASFTIGRGVYGPLFKDALRSFWLNRCGVAIDDRVTGVQHAACHLGDAPFHEDPKKKGDFTGGWHNAGDYGKWIHMEAISCAWMMWLYEFKAGEMEAFRTDIPESSNRKPDILDEARWGLEWMLKMQKPDGSVRHKVDPEKDFCFGTVPERDRTPRIVKGCGSIDAGVFCGAMCQASRVFRDKDPDFAKRCLAAAKRAWAWLEKNPSVVQEDFAYKDSDPTQEALWALGEMARTTGDLRLMERFTKEGVDYRLQPLSWMQPQLFGYMAVYFGPDTKDEEKARIRGAMAKACDPLVDRSEANGYGVSTLPSEYYWESNEALLNKTCGLLTAFQATGEAKYRKVALRQMNWLLGTNGLDISFVTGHGERAVSHPYHWADASLGKVMPGWAAGGPNQYAEGADPLLLDLIKRGMPPAKCFVDSNASSGSWASNEGETSENAALVFAAGYLSAE